VISHALNAQNRLWRPKITYHHSTKPTFSCRRANFRRVAADFDQNPQPVGWKQVIGDGLRSRIDERRVTEVSVAVHALNRMLALGRPNYVRIV
jgi:hypothetical protein